MVMLSPDNDEPPEWLLMKTAKICLRQPSVTRQVKELRPLTPKKGKAPPEAD
jgi:hypothetical protein